MPPAASTYHASDGTAVWDFRGGLVYQRLFWDTAAGLDPRAGDAWAIIKASNVMIGK